MISTEDLRRVSKASRQIVFSCAMALATSAVSVASPILYSIGGDDSGIPRRVTSVDPGLGTTLCAECRLDGL
jgi:hypothetical protein